MLGLLAIVLVMVQSWRSLALAADAHELAVERSRAAATRILQQAVGDRTMFERVPAGQRCAVVAGELVIDDDVGWLDPIDTERSGDPVVQDRLDRAARAEFAAGDVDAAAREFAALLAGTPAAADRAQVLAAAAWQARRAGRGDQESAWLAELDTTLAALPRREFARVAVQQAAMSALRLRADEVWPGWCVRTASALTPVALRSLPAARLASGTGTAIVAAATASADRRERLRQARSWLAGRGRRPELLAMPAVAEWLWWFPGEDHRDAVATLPPTDFAQLVLAAAGAGLLPTWPWLLVPRPSAMPPASMTPVDALGLVQLQATTDAARSGPALLAWTTIALVVGFAGLLVLQFRAVRRESAAARQQSEFLTTVTHELKTPLASIRLLAEMLAEGRARGREHDYYGMLAGEAGRLSMLIENVLDLGRTESGERPLDRRVVDLRDVVQETVALFLPLAAHEGLQVELQPGAACPVAIDRARFTQALRNVLDNACKYAAGGGRLVVGVSTTGPAITLIVRDFGPGVPTSERERIFGRFVRGSQHQSGGIPGVGIGLHLARVLMRRHGGELSCREPADGGAGAEFVFTLPGGA